MLRRTALPLVLLLVVSLATPGIAPGKGKGPALAGDGPPGHPACLPATIVDNEDVRIWFHGAKAMLKVWEKNDTTGANDAGYQYKTRAIRELDAEGNEVAWFNYNRAQPKNSSCTVEEDDTFVNVTYTVTDDVRPRHGGKALGEATITFEYHFNKTNTSAKFDLLVEDWPWQADGTLAYDFVVTSENWTIEPAENGLGFADEQGMPEAFIEWAENATATYEDDHEEVANVTSAVDATDHRAFVRLEFVDASPGYVELDYDPTVGVGPYLILANRLIVIEALVPLPQPARRVLHTVF